MQAGGLSVFHEGLCEYELVDIAEASGTTPLAQGLALSLLRATGMLSRLTTLNRPLPAGPVDPLEGPQLQGPVTLRYALALGEQDPYALADEAFLDMAVAASLGGGELELEASLLSVTGAQVSALHRVAGALEMRVFNPDSKAARVEVRSSDGTGPVGLTAPVRGHLVDLRGRFVASFEGSFALGPHAIATARLLGR